MAVDEIIVPADSSPIRDRIRRGLKEHSLTLGLALTLAVFVVAVGAAFPTFVSPENLRNLINSNLAQVILTLGMAVLLIQGAVDISVGATIGVSAIVVARTLEGGGGVILGITAALLFGLILGLVNGAITYFGRIPAIVVTIGTLSVWGALAFWLLDGRYITGIPPLVPWLTKGVIGPITPGLIIVILLYAGTAFLLKRTLTGRRIYQIGGNTDAARMLGLPIRRIGLLSFGFMGILLGFAGITYVTVNGSVEAGAGLDLPLMAVAACVLGGVSLMGGRGHVVAVLFAAMLLAVLKNGAIIMGVPSLFVNSIVGAILLIAATVNATAQKRAVAKQREPGQGVTA